MLKKNADVQPSVAYQKKVLLLDEPFKGLDEKNRAVITERINKLRSKRTIIIAASDPVYHSLSPDQVILLNNKITN